MTEKNYTFELKSTTSIQTDHGTENKPLYSAFQQAVLRVKDE